MKFNLKNAILKHTKYKRNYKQQDNEYVFSASMFAKEPLQNYLTIIHGNHDDKEITDATLGSIFHKGMEEIIYKEREDLNGSESLLIEHSMNKRLPNGWMLTGTADLIIRRAEDESSSIHDYKLTKSYALKMIRKDLYIHDYTKQLQALDLLNMNENPYPDPKPSELNIEVFIKDAKAIDKEQTYNNVIAPNADYEETEGEIIAITDQLQEYIENGDIPPVCHDVWPRKLKNGVTINTKCALYCNHGKAGVCPHYQPNTRESVARILSW